MGIHWGLVHCVWSYWSWVLLFRYALVIYHLVAKLTSGDKVGGLLRFQLRGEGLIREGDLLELLWYSVRFCLIAQFEYLKFFDAFYNNISLSS